MWPADTSDMSMTLLLSMDPQWTHREASRCPVGQLTLRLESFYPLIKMVQIDGPQYESWLVSLSPLVRFIPLVSVVLYCPPRVSLHPDLSIKTAYKHCAVPSVQSKWIRDLSWFAYRKWSRRPMSALRHLHTEQSCVCVCVSLTICVVLERFPDNVFILFYFILYIALLIKLHHW